MKKLFSRSIALAMSLSLMLAAGCNNSGSNTSTSGGSSGETDWPKETINMVLPYAAGGDTDTYCRQMSKLLSEELGVNVVVVNTEGGAGVVASSSVMTAKNDGYTALFHHTGTMLTQEAAGSNEFSFYDDFDVVATVARDDTYTLIAKADDPRFSNLEEMIDWAKANPGQLKYSITYFGATHAVATLMEQTMGIEMNCIDVGSSTADRLTAFLAGQCDILVVNYMNIADYVENGDFVVLGVCADERVPGVDFPTLKEQGYDVVQSKQYEVRLPKDTDPAIVEKLSAAIEKVTTSDEFAETLATYYAQPFYRNAADTISQDLADVEELKGLFAQ